jgi:aminoglycoside phosphotransferase (APT) family kinase protein
MTHYNSNMPIDINLSLVSRLIAEQFPQWAYLPINPVGSSGWDNRTFHLGEHMTVRLPRAAAYAQQVEKEQRWLPRLAPLLRQAAVIVFHKGIASFKALSRILPFIVSS